MFGGGVLCVVSVELLTKRRFSVVRVGWQDRTGQDRMLYHIPNRPFLELPFLEEVGKAICFPERHAVACGESEVELAIGVSDERIGCCLGRDVQACAVVVWWHLGQSENISSLWRT